MKITNESIKKSKFNTNEDWVNYLTKKLDLDADESEDLLHDLNNLRADEWVEVLVDSDVSSNIINQFKTFFEIEDEDDDWEMESIKKNIKLEKGAKKLKEDVDYDDEDDDWEEDEEYEYTVEVDLPCFVRAYITTNERLTVDEVKDLVADWISSNEYSNGSADVEFYGDEIEDFDIDTIEINTDYIDRLSVEEGRMV